MNPDATGRLVPVLLPAVFIDALLKLDEAWQGNLTLILESALADQAQQTTDTNQQPTPVASVPLRGKYCAEYLGVRFAKWTLPEVFAEVVDMTEIAAPEVLVRMSEIQTTRRRFIGRTREAVHLGNKRLPVMLTASGWWISRNIGQEDLKRAMRALCSTAQLSFDRDFKFQMLPDSQ
jgi:hypothetical protein